jgi:hypothetical protein
VPPIFWLDDGLVLASPARESVLPELLELPELWVVLPPELLELVLEVFLLLDPHAVIAIAQAIATNAPSVSRNGRM